MPNATFGANAPAMPNRRAAISSLAAAAGAILAPRAVKSDEDHPSVELSALIAAHQKARAEFADAVDELEAAAPDPMIYVRGIGSLTYTLRNGRERVAKCINDHCERLSRALQAVAAISKTVGPDALAALEDERVAALARLDAAYAEEDAAKARWDEKCEVEENALLAVCAYRCATPADTGHKFRYLLRFKDEMTEEHIDGIYASLLPEGEA